jgi:hypothetical protein
MKKIIRLTESDLTRIVRRVINEEKEMTNPCESWEDMAKYIKSSKLEIQGFKFKRFIESNEVNPAVFENPTTKTTLHLKPKKTWDVYNSSGRGVKSGNWSCQAMPGSGYKINLGVDISKLK